MINTAWDEYRSWASRVRKLQTSSQKWNEAALICAAAAAVLGAAASKTAGDPVIEVETTCETGYFNHKT